MNSGQQRPLSKQWLAFLRMILEVVYCLTYRHTFVNGHENTCPQIHHHIDTENSIKTDTLTHSILEKKWVPITKEWNKSLGTECPWELLHSCKHVFSFLLYFPHLFSSTVISVCFRLCYIFPISLALSMSSQLQRNVRIRSTFFFPGKLDFNSQMRVLYHQTLSTEPRHSMLHTPLRVRTLWRSQIKSENTCKCQKEMWGDFLN